MLQIWKINYTKNSIMIALLQRYFKQYIITQYRIVKDDYAGYECQKTFLWLFWVEIGCNTHLSINDAVTFIERRGKKRYNFIKLNEKLNEERR